MIRHVRLLEGFGYVSRKDKEGKPENPQLYKNLVGKTFEFFPDKVNIIFGPNGSGKTTLLRAMAGMVGCEDGFTKKIKWISDDKDPREVILGKYKELAKNEIALDWDGAPVYYENFRDTLENRSYGSIGDLEGSVLRDGMEEISYIFNKSRISEGQKSLYFLSQVCKIFEKDKPSWEQILKGASEKQLEYHKALIEEGAETYTLLLDESERSFDIEKQISFLCRALPNMMRMFGIQIIAISHNHLILSDKIFENPVYNIISLDQEYTETSRKYLKKLWQTEYSEG